MSKEWVKQVKELKDKELIKELESKMGDLYYKDVLFSEFLIRILKDKY